MHTFEFLFKHQTGITLSKKPNAGSVPIRMENETCSSEEQKLPLRILVASNNPNSPALDVTILAPAPGLQIHHLTNTSVINKKLFFLKPEVFPYLQNALSFHVKQESTSDSSKYGYLVRCSLIPNAFQLLEAPVKPPREIFSGSDETICIPDTFEANIDLWKLPLDLPEPVSIPHFSMKPPKAAAILQPPRKADYTLSPQNETDPQSFLFARYFSTLYSFTTPLSYFAKTALSRFRNLCKNDPATKKENLLALYLTTDQLEARQSNKYGLDLTQDPITVSIYEQQNRDLFINKNSTDLRKEEPLRKFVFELKIREAQLQILLLMELLLCWGKDEVSFLEENAKIQEKKAKKSLKVSLVRSKKRRKKIIPTFLGVSIQESPEKIGLPTSTVVSESMLYISLISLVDQMSIWDILLGRVKGSKDDSMYGFLAYVLVPYFKSQLPETVNFIIQKVKELRPKLHVSRSRSKATRSKSTSQLPESVSDNMEQSEAMEKSTQPKKSSKFSKTLLSSEKVPFLHRSSTDMASTGVPADLQPAFLLKRSKSNLASKNLKRRQVDMSLVRTESQDAEELKKNKLFLFGDARKIKSVPAENSKDLLVRQVEATPAKNNRTVPRKNTFSQVMETPSTHRIKELPHVLETPQHSYAKPFAAPKQPKLTMNEMFAQLAPPEDPSFNITSSPVRNLEVHDTPVNRHMIIESSPPLPASAVSTSRAEVVAKSEAKPALRSPFGGVLDGSPTKKRRQPNRLASPKAPEMLPPVLSIGRQEAPVSQTRSFGVHVKDAVPMAHTDTVVDTFPEPLSITATSFVTDDSRDDSGSDSDLEKLLEFSSRPRLKTYGKR